MRQAGFVGVLMLASCTVYRPRADAPDLDPLPEDHPVRIYEVGDPLPPHEVLGELKIPVNLFQGDEAAFKKAKKQARKRGGDGLVVEHRPGAWYENRKYEFRILKLR